MRENDEPGPEPDIDEQERVRRAEELASIAERSAARPVLDSRSAEEILGYGPDGLPF